MSDSQDGIPEAAQTTEPLTRGELVTAIIAGFAPQFRAQVRQADVEAVVADLDLEGYRAERRAPQLRLRGLRFCGKKRWTADDEGTPFSYEQAFAPGVNVLLVPDNNVGKSTIRKTIKFALTGDADDYDLDVKSWISDVWLTFALDKQVFTVLLSTGASRLRALLVAGEEQRPLEEVAESERITIFDAEGAEEVKEALREFFFKRLGLPVLSWNQTLPSPPGGVAERSTSWLTYFQALNIPERGADYLICDREHSFGGQDGLILSTFLGLRLTEPLNQLSVEASRARKEVRSEQQLTAEVMQQAQADIERLQGELRATREEIAVHTQAQHDRLRLVEQGEPARRLVEVQTLVVERSTEVTELRLQTRELTGRIQRGRARSRHLRAAVELRLHFSGLEVRLCPNCDTEVSSEAVEMERSNHVCRLCGTEAHAAEADEIATMEAEIRAADRAIGDDERERGRLNARIRELETQIPSLTNEIAQLEEAAKRGIAFALPTPEEQARLFELHEVVGRLNAEITAAQRRMQPQREEELSADQYRRIVEKAQEILGREATKRNDSLLRRLSTLTRETASRIGVESVTNITCTARGKVQLRKHNATVTFGSINNEGERIRVKLAFFLALMRLGSEPGLGRHPGMLLIDQPGSAEMVSDDRAALAAVLRQVETELADEVQIICFTAQPEFAGATVPDKIYGPQAGDKTF